MRLGSSLYFLRKMAYSQNEKWISINETTSTKNHSSSHIFAIDEKKNFIFGQNKKYKNLAHFGGFPNPDETVMETAIREFQEESLNSIIDTQKLHNLLQDPHFTKVSFAQSIKNNVYSNHYCFFLRSHDFDFNSAESQFSINRENPHLSIDQQENQCLVTIPHRNIYDSIYHLLDEEIVTLDSVQNIHVCDKNNNSYLLRSYTIFPLIFLFKRSLINF